MPRFSSGSPTEVETSAAALLKDHFGISASLKPLAGEVDLNFLAGSDDGKQYLLKISQVGAIQAEIDFQIAIIEHLHAKNLPFLIPTAVKSKSGELFITVEDETNQARFMRVQEWVDGRMIAALSPRSATLLRSWGETAAHLNAALEDFDHPEAHRSYKWNPSRTLESRSHEQYFSEEQRAISDYFWGRFEDYIQSKLPHLRCGVNYNDAHEMNLLVGVEKGASQISGVIDFGDSLYTQTINELAIAAAYGAMDMPDPLSAVCELVRGFHMVQPLTELEVAVLYDLIAARLLITVATAASNLQAEPDNPYLQVSAKPAWALLAKWKSISPQLSHFRFRAACGWEAVPQRIAFHEWLNQKPLIHELMSLPGKQVTHLDLSVSSLDLGSNERFLEIAPFKQTLTQLLNDAEADFGVGGYAEVRPFYTTDAYQVIGNEGAQWRTVHLGLDVWGPALTPVFAPLDGMVHSVADNVGERDYGPTLILKHEVTEELTFFTLYGHLSRASLSRLEVGQKIAAGDEVATIGPAPENGNWPPHLHFQIILDMLDETHDFPGVCYPSERSTWLSLCPDPALIFPDLTSQEEPRWDIEKIQSKRAGALGKSLSISYEQPLHIVRGYGAYLYDQNARRYLDTVNNVAHVGHEHPSVVRAARRQLAVLNTNTRYLHENVVRFAEELAATLPPELSVVHLVNSGSEANELALRMAKTWSGQKDMIAVEVGYHGNTGACIDVSSYKFDGKGGKGAPPHTHIVPMPNVYRGLHRNPGDAGAKYAKYVVEAIQQIQAQGRNVAGFICESILSCGGQITLPDRYLKKAFAAVRAAGGLCISDEVQVGFGRVGEHFWGFQLQGAVPDIVTLGKPIGNGHPLAAVVTTPAVAAAFANGMEFFNTFGGNPVSAAIGRAVLSTIKEEGLQQNALNTGAYLRRGLLDLQSEFPLVGDVRGPGFFQGIELVRDRTSLEPAANEATYLANRMRQRGILMSTDGPLHNVLKIKPPMCFSRKNVDFLLENLKLVLSEDFLQV